MPKAMGLSMSDANRLLLSASRGRGAVYPMPCGYPTRPPKWARTWGRPKLCHVLDNVLDRRRIA